MSLHLATAAGQAKLTLTRIIDATQVVLQIRLQLLKGFAFGRRTDFRPFLGMMLRLMGNDTRTAYDGEEAVAAAGEFRPEVVLLDIGLPRVNG